MADTHEVFDKIINNALKTAAEKVSEAAETIADALEGTDVSIDITIDPASPEMRTFRTGIHPDTKSASDDSFWDLGQPRQKKYAPPTFEGHTVGVTEIEDESADHRTARSEKIPPRSSSPKVVNTVDGPRYVTSSYRNRSAHTKYRGTQSSMNSPRREASKEVRSYSPDSMLIKKIDVRSWETDVEFYGRFANDALSSHNAAPSVHYTQPNSPVPYNSYVPQYSHMNRMQVEYYRWVRENIRHGVFPVCDAAYLQLYIFEIINLPEVIPPAEGASILAKIWTGYRKVYPRLDGYLCEWMADYCMIHALPLPDEIKNIRHEIAHKAQFKEFYLDMPKNPTADEMADTAKALLEVSSDYDYRTSRYYTENRDAYEKHIPAAIAEVLIQSHRSGRGILSLERIYKMTRDSYCGAIVSSGIKRRVDIEFSSFTRRADSRQSITALAKYAENKVRVICGVKAKLGCDKADAEDTAVIDRYFAPMITDKVKKSSDDKYMPDDYLKNYEAEDSGFDFSAAAEIEKQSWINTSRLTGESFTDTVQSAEEYTAEDAPTVDGEIGFETTVIESGSDETDTSETIIPTAHDAEEAEEAKASQTAETADEADITDKTDVSLEKEAVRAALAGEFKKFCREHGLYEGEIADRVNNVFLDEIGDIILENNGSGYALIEDYREDTENWLTI